MARRKKPDGFDSRFEQEVFEASDKRKTTYHPEKFKYVVERTYTPDFKIKGRRGKEIYVETKGYWTGSDRSKHLAVVAQNPDIDLRLVFMNAHNRLNKRSKTTYAMWCDKHGVKWAEKRIPKEWYNER